MSVTVSHEKVADNIHETGLEVHGNHGDFLTRSTRRIDVSENAPCVIILQGIVSAPYDPSAVAIHDSMQLVPGVGQVFTVGNNGMGIRSGGDHASREETADDRIDFAQTVAVNKPIILASISMGEQTKVDMILRAKQRRELLETVIGSVGLAPGTVHPNRSKRKADTLLSNVVRTTGDYAINHFFDYMLHPTRVGDALLELSLVSARTQTHSQVIEHHRRTVEKGTPPELVLEAALEIPTAIEVGLDDGVYDPGMYRPLGKSGVISLKEYKDVGHNASFMPELGAPMLTHGIHRALAMGGYQLSADRPHGHLSLFSRPAVA